MKIILTIVISCMFLLCQAQKLVQLNHNITIKVPKEAVRYIEPKLVQKKDDIVPVELLESIRKNSYKIGNMLVRFHVGENMPEVDYLERTKHTRDMNKEGKSDSEYSSALKTVNGNEILIINYNTDKVRNYEFFSFDRKSRRVFRGLIYYETGERTKAFDAMNYMLENLIFN